jgi:hypothetical protein
VLFFLLEKDMSENNAQARRYRDELNFAEFPLAALSDTVPDDQKTLVFTDTVFDRGAQAEVLRRLTITASDEYGLPTAQDDEVILGLIQLTSKQGFMDRRVHFTRRELIKELAWRDESKSYARIAQSLKRWLGVTLYYEKAWWSNEEKCWVDESFHVLDQVTIFDKERIMRRVKSLPDDPKAGLSSFLWNEVVFNSFRAGYLKQLDFELYKSLRSQIAKRMYRFLDKRFYHRARYEFDLAEFAFAKVGLSQKYHTGEIKRRLRPAITELEEVGFLERLSEEKRFLKKSRGEWGIVFVKAAREGRAPREEMTDNPLFQKLTCHGITGKVAAAIVRDFDAQRIEEKIRLVEWLKEKKDSRITRNAAGFLVKAIQDNYPLPAEMTAAAPTSSREGVRAPKNSEQRTRRDNSEKALRSAIDAFWSSLSEDEKHSLEEDALRGGNKFLVRQYVTTKENGGPLFEAARSTLLDNEKKKRLPVAKAA